MSHRHSDENRVTPGSTPTKTRRLVEWLHQRATRRKLVLLECGIVRHAPFADCGRPLWDLMTDQSWFETTLPAAEWLRILRKTGRAPAVDLGGDRSWLYFRMNGHRAIEWLEKTADGGADDDRLFLAEEYFVIAEHSAEAGLFDPDDRRDELKISYGAAYWLLSLRGFGPERWNVLDYYLAHFSGAFYCWADWRPLHPGHRSVALSLIDDILGHPLHFVQFDAAWRTAEAVALASTMYETRDFTLAPTLADALERAGCDNGDVLSHCRAERIHCRGCWVVDRLLGKS